MKIRYKGLAGIRIIDPKEFFESHEYAPEGVIEEKPYQWDASNGFVQDVKEAELVEELLTYPTNEFEVAAEEYLAKLAESGLSGEETIEVVTTEMPVDEIDEGEGG